ncbi:16S rRNA processing protein RimM [Deferribacter autotrophicus]|uniref:Ribosome maturation factor RimM n=1 Tax=Deferribacter autotrophicus TaxID=500465 RepID=A0A5A8F6Q8_9BACT|nr:ribosome maturation factor RimM [Deferribacter autotrophicus]KAA0258529.1 16S rRNA processing protein RimM [Deferribacter autotrophicus]
MKYIKIGVIKNSHGLDGEVKVLPITEHPELFETLDVLLLSKKGEIVKSLRVEDIRTHNEYYLIKLENINDKETAKTLSGLEIMYPIHLLPELDENEYYWFEIEGWEVYDTEDNFIGTLVDYEETGTAEAFIIKGESTYYMISNNKEHVLKMDKNKKRIIINRDGLVSEDI